MILCIVGPTGIGKSSLALKIAKATGAEIINGDAFQTYKQMQIGTAKPTFEEMDGVTHHLYSINDVDHQFTIFEYQKLLRETIEKLQKENRKIIIVGGSGLYLKSALYDFELKENPSSIDMSKYERMDEMELHKVLEEIDPSEAQKIHFHNKKRVLRAIQIYLENQKPKSELIKEQKHVLLYPVYFLGLNKNREDLYQLINNRVDKMFDQGLLDEVKNLMNNYPHDLKSFYAIGYKEIINGIDTLSIEEIKEVIKKNSRNYAKRQFTYFKNQLDVHWFDSLDEAFKEGVRKVQE